MPAIAYVLSGDESKLCVGLIPGQFPSFYSIYCTQVIAYSISVPRFLSNVTLQTGPPLIHCSPHATFHHPPFPDVLWPNQDEHLVGPRPGERSLLARPQMEDPSENS